MSTEVNISLCSPRPSSGQDLNTTVLVISSKPLDCPINHVLIKVDRFGFSANNITYQALGEHPHFRRASSYLKKKKVFSWLNCLRYFDFHPTPECEATSVSPKTHGLIPVWGFGTIEKSSHPKIQEGERVYGYFAPTRYLLVSLSPSDVNKFSFYVSRPHLPAGTFVNWTLHSPLKINYPQIVAPITKSFDALQIHSILLRLLRKISQCSIVHYSGLHIGAKTGFTVPTTVPGFPASSSHLPHPRRRSVLPTWLGNVFVLVKSVETQKSSDLRLKEMSISRNGLHSIMKCSSTTRSRPPTLFKELKIAGGFM